MYQHSGGEVLVGLKQLDTTRKPLSMLSDEELLELIKDNDKNALEFLINIYPSENESLFCRWRRSRGCHTRRIDWTL